MFFSLKDDKKECKNEGKKPSSEVELPNFSLNPPPKDNPQKDNKNLIENIKNRVTKYIMADCNANNDLISKSNIDILVNNDEISIKATKNGIGCINEINKIFIEDIINQEAEGKFKVKFE